MTKRNRLVSVIVLLLAAFMLLSACAASASGYKENRPEKTESFLAMDAAQELVDYLDEHGELPDNFIRKKEAEARGWKTTYRYVGDIGNGLAIGGDYFGNYEERLPVVRGRKYYEADCYYQGRQRNEYRLIYSNDGHYWFTEDHYETFVELFPTKEDSSLRSE